MVLPDKKVINLKHEESGGLVKIIEKSGARKDRYSSLSYNYYVACQLEKNIKQKTSSTSNDSNLFLFRAPKVK